jgi:hypothetical protein
LLIESKFFVWAAVAGFLLALVVTRGNLMAGFAAFALIAGSGWAVHKIYQHMSGAKHHE